MNRPALIQFLPVVVLLGGLFVTGGCGTSGPGPDEVPDVLVTDEPAVAEPAASPTAETQMAFWSDDIKVDHGACTTLQWESTGSRQVYLDGRGVELTGTEEVCLTETTTYELTVLYQDASEDVASVTIDVTTPTAMPTSTRVPVTRAPQATAAPTAEPTSEAFVEFYPNNHVYRLPEDQQCTSVHWETRGVTDVHLEREGFGRKPVDPSGSEEVCWEGRKRVKYFLHFKYPDGRDDLREIELERSS